MVSLHFDASGFDVLRRALRKLPRVLDDELEKALRRTSREVVKEAKRSHGYQDRTGRLTRSITSYENTGTFSAGTLSGLVGAPTPYASYVEEGTTRARAFRYLGTAWLLQREETERRMSDALEGALRRAGLST